MAAFANRKRWRVERRAERRFLQSPAFAAISEGIISDLLRQPKDLQFFRYGFQITIGF